MTIAAERDAEGRYKHSRFDRVCRCGHSCGQHTAARVGGEQLCTDNDCSCAVFTRIARDEVESRFLDLVEAVERAAEDSRWVPLVEALNVALRVAHGPLAIVREARS